MKKLIKEKVLKNVVSGNEQLDQETLDYITKRINAILDVPLLNEALEEIIIQAILKIVYNVLIVRKDFISRA
jgi:hypothetical protein